MPIVRIEMLAGRSPETKERLAAEVTQSVSRLCNVEPVHIYVMFNDVLHQDWAVAGKVFSTSQGATSQVTTSTSTAQRPAS